MASGEVLFLPKGAIPKTEMASMMNDEVMEYSGTLNIRWSTLFVLVETPQVTLYSATL